MDMTTRQWHEPHSIRDPVTGLVQRDAFVGKITEALERTKRDDTALALLVFNLDNFSDVNDRVGQPAGDSLLAAVAERLKGSLRPNDTIARFVADEFGILLEGMTYAGAAEVAERIGASLNMPFDVLGREIFIGGSIGLCVDYAGEQTSEEILSNADVALYTAKTGGKGRAEIYEPGMHGAVIARLQLEAELRHAVENQELILNYQPLIDLESGKVVALEALVRWTHADRGPVSPAEFVPMAENADLMKIIGRFVIEEVCRQAERLAAAYPGRPPLDLTINLSFKQLFDPDFPEEAARILRGSGVQPQRLVFEISEEVLMKDTETATTALEELKAVGVKLAIDDFGTGYSSLIYLQRFPIDAIKIDKQFIDGGLAGRLQDSSLARLIVELGKSLGLRIIAEGVERIDHLNEVKAMEFDAAQGYFFAKPLSSDEVMQFLAKGYDEGGA